jgi:hypothetical protein
MFDRFPVVTTAKLLNYLMRVWSFCNFVGTEITQIVAANQV